MAVTFTEVLMHVNVPDTEAVAFNIGGCVMLATAVALPLPLEPVTVTV